MSVHSVQSNHAAVQTLAVSQVQSNEKQASQNDAVPVDKVTISAEAQARQTASAIGAVPDHSGQ